GALAFTILTGAPPAADLSERARVFRERRCLDPRTLDESVPEGVAQAVAFASHEVIAQRADDAGDWLELLLDEATEPERVPESDISPLHARPDDAVGPYKV